MSNPNDNKINKMDDNQPKDEQIRPNNLFTYDISYKKQLEEEPQHKLKGFDTLNPSRNQIEYCPEDLNFMKSQSFYYKAQHQQQNQQQQQQQHQAKNSPYTYGDFYANNYTNNSFSPQEYEYMASIRMQKEARRKPKIRVCTNCSTTNTPSWRRSKDGRLLLCNACGLYAKLHGRPRPFSKSIDGRTKALKPHFERFTCYNCRLSGIKLFVQSNNGMLICRQCGEPEQFSIAYRNNYAQESNNYYQPPTQQQIQYSVNSQSMYQGNLTSNNTEGGFDSTFNPVNLLNPKQQSSGDLPYNQTPQQFGNYYQNSKLMNNDIKPKHMYTEKQDPKKADKKNDTLGYQDSYFEGKYGDFEGARDEDIDEL